jgi:cobalamin biosynthesis protein CobD/CbiB
MENNDDKIDSIESIEEESKFEKWFESIEDKPMKEAFQSIFSSIGNIKFKYFAYGLMIVLCIAVAIPIVLLIVKYIAPYVWDIAKLIIGTIIYNFIMAIGSSIDYGDTTYKFLDNDLLLTIPVCLVVSLIVGNNTNFKSNFLFGCFYFVFLVASLECWNYLHTNNNIEAVWGGIYFVIFFTVIPALTIIRNNVEITIKTTDENNKEQDTDNILVKP